MATILCQACNKLNPDTLEICQFCGTPLKNRGTEPLPTIHPGEVPVKQQTSELESTLPSWLRDMRKGDDGQNAEPTSTANNAPAAPQPAKPSVPQKPDASPLDFLAGLSQLDDEEEAEPDWLSSLKGNLPSTPAPAQPEAPVDWTAGLMGNSPPAPTASAASQEEQPTDWLAGFQDDSQHQNAQPATDWGFGDLTSSEPEKSVSDWGGFNDQAEEPVQPAVSASEETPDWLAALKAQDTNVNAPVQPTKSEDFSFENSDTSSGDFPDWLSGLGGEPAPTVASASAETFPSAFAADDSPSDGADDLSGWLSGMAAQSSATPASPAAEESTLAYSAPSSESTASDTGDFPDWLANLGGENAPAPEKPQPTPSSPVAPSASQDAPASDDFPDWLANLGGEGTPTLQEPQPTSSSPVTPGTSQAAPASDDFPDWLANLGDESTPAPINSLAAQDSSAVDAPPDWLSAHTSEAPTEPVIETPSASSPSIFDNLLMDDGIGWLEPTAEEKQKPAPAPDNPPLPKQKAFSTGSLEELTPLKKTDDVPDWLAGLSATMPKKASEPSALPDLPNNDAFDWLSDSGQTEHKPTATESMSPGQVESAVEKPTAAELPSTAFLPDSSQNLDSIFSMEMPDWLSGFTPSEQAQPVQAAPGEQPAAFDNDNLSPADLPSWVQAMRPLESVVSGTQSAADDQTVEQEGPLAGLRSVLPAQVNAPGMRKPKAYSIKLQVDSTQLAQATLLENLIASEAESRPVVTAKRVVNIRPLRWIIAVVLLLAMLVPGVLGKKLFPLSFPLPVLSDPSNAETAAFYDYVEKLPDASKVLVVFDYQPAYAGEMEQATGPILLHLMTKNARLAFVSTLPTGVLMSERLMAKVDPDADSSPDVVDKLYTKGIQYIDLGYLPGDAAGIQVFAENPNILGNDYQAGNLWTPASGLDKIDNKLSNFDVAIVLTDNPDTGRMWIEQAGSVLAGKMLMVVSAQAAPMIRPYYESNQVVKGMVSGLSGGALYEVAAQQSTGNVSNYYWPSYGTGMIAAEVLIVVGAIWAFLQRLRMRRAEQNQEEDEE
jgi:hypothetical protein